MVAQREAAGGRVGGPTAQTIRDLADPARLAALGRESGLSPVPDHLTPADWRRIEIDVLADSAGTVWTLGLRDASIRRGPTPVLAEMPAPGVSDTTAGAMSHAVRRLVRAAAYRGAGVVELALAHDGESFWLVGVDTLARTEHALVEEITGASFIGLRLRLAAGGTLPAEPPTPNGHAVEVRLLAHDPGREYAASGGALEMLSPGRKLADLSSTFVCALLIGGAILAWAVVEGGASCKRAVHRFSGGRVAEGPIGVVQCDARDAKKQHDA